MPVITGFESLNFRAVATIYHRLKNVGYLYIIGDKNAGPFLALH
jgi:hypothetical protein